MIKSIKLFFAETIQADREPANNGKSIQLATAALLLEVSRADFHVQQEELEVIANSLQQQFQFSREETDNLLKLALTESDASSSLHPFVHLINQEFTIDQKYAIMEAMWKVAYADERLDKYEEYQIRKIADLLYIPHKEFIRSKLRVQKELKLAT